MGEKTEEQTFRYDSPEQLKLLLGLISDQSMELSVWMKAVVSAEFTEAKSGLERLASELQYDEQYRFSNQFYEQAAVRIDEAMQKLVDVAKKEKVLPFHHLKCGYFFEHPDIKNTYGESMGCLISNPHKTVNLQQELHPLNALMGWRYNGIIMETVREPINIQKAKQTVFSLPSDQYVISSLSGGLNPRDWTSHYAGGTDYDGSIWASDGTITLRGKATIDQKAKAALLEAMAKIGLTPERPALTGDSNG